MNAYAICWSTRLGRWTFRSLTLPGSLQALKAWPKSCGPDSHAWSPPRDQGKNWLTKATAC